MHINRTSLQLLLGAGIAATISVFIALAWPTLYATSYWPGYASAAASGLIPHEFTSSPRAMVHALAFFAVTGTAVGLLFISSSRGVVTTWCGIWSGLILVAAVSPWTWRSNLAPIIVVVYPIFTTPFLVMATVGYFGGAALRRHAG